MPLRKELGLLELIIIGIAGAVGTGVLFSSAGMAAVAGPGVVLGWIIGSIFYFFVSLTYVELSLTYPEAGGPSRYALYSHGRVTNFINAMADLIWYLFIPPIEALAVVEGLNYFYPYLINSQDVPTIQGVLVGVALLVFFIPFNYFGVKAFGKSTLTFGTIKLLMYIAVALGVIFVGFNLGNFTNYGFLPFGVAGVFSAVPLAMFAFGGIRVLPDYAEEVKEPKKLKEGIILTVIGQSLIYVLFAIAFVGSLNWKGLGISEGNWASIGNLPGNPFIDIASSYHANLLLLLTVIIGIVGPFVTGYIYLGAGTRVLFAMSRSGYMPKVMEDLHQKYAIPSWALLVFAIVGAIVTYISSPLPTIYGLISDSVIAGYLGFSVNPIAMTVLRKQGVTKKIIPAGEVIAAIAFVSASLIVFWSGWPSVPYAVLLLTIGAIIFGLIFKVRENFTNSLWYIVYIAFLTLMSYVGSDGALNLINFYLSSAIVALVSLAVFYPWGVYSGLKEIRLKKI
ncbi:APC family permease [Stygiolobus caldivivus]|uniref:Amino acid transporter n=1 Tax=Stygiolobus caldivivus TaxID=2824673 RepID=A0A8D5ZJZ3_9CREN|nr:APC family permease [Stygiolobus caldivivus]BCU70860.1 amino acid transporter [Stygiolobus caldivivus]